MTRTVNDVLDFQINNTKAWMMPMDIVLVCLLLTLNMYTLYKIHHINIALLFDIFEQFKGYLRYKTIFCHKVALHAQLMNFF